MHNESNANAYAKRCDEKHENQEQKVKKNFFIDE
jgi:hypothetical protein